MKHIPPLHTIMMSGMLLRVRTSVHNSSNYVITSPGCICLTGFRKKLDAAAKQKGCELIGKWRRSIINHFYWCVSSTPDGDTETILAKWLSVENHVHNKHRHKDKKFPKCAHGNLRGQERKKKWFKRRKYYIHSSPFTLIMYIH